MNNKASIDYLRLQGAEVKSVEINGKPMNCIVIPVAWNGIKVTADTATGSPVSATQYLREWETNQKYKDACIANHLGEADYLPPSHQISVSYSEELGGAYKKRHELRLRSDAKFMATHPTDDDIKKRAAYELSNQTRIGTVTPMKRQEPPIYTGAAPAVAVGSYIPPTNEDAQEDDLPF